MSHNADTSGPARAAEGKFPFNRYWSLDSIEFFNQAVARGESDERICGVLRFKVPPEVVLERLRMTRGK